MSKVVQIESLRLTRSQRSWSQPGCKHMNLTMDDQGDIVTCDDCNKQVSAFWALQMLAEEYDKAFHKLNVRAQQQTQVEGKTIHLKAAQVVESAWRSRTMVPTCPHCSEAIFATDRFGYSAVNKEMALRRRAVRAAPAHPGEEKEES